MVCKNYIIKQITILSSPFRLDNNRIMVENYGESIQDRSIPNPVTTFAEAYADFRELSHCIPFFKYRTFHTKDFLHKSSSTSFGPFAQFLVVISHNNYKWETLIWKVYYLIMIKHFTFTCHFQQDPMART